METKILKSLSLLFVLLTFTACSNDDDSGPNYTEENFFMGYLNSSGLNENKESFFNTENYEFGLDFTPKVTGKIIALKVSLPDANPALKITIWNKATNTISRTEVVNVLSADTEFVFDIADLQLTKDNEYAISLNTNNWYQRNKLDLSAVVYPITVGNIQINACKWVTGSTQTYPTNMADNFYAVDLSFDFIQTE